MLDLVDKKYMATNEWGMDISERVRVAMEDILDRVKVGDMNPIEAELITLHTITGMFAAYRLRTGANARKENK